MSESAERARRVLEPMIRRPSWQRLPAEMREERIRRVWANVRNGPATSCE